MNFKSFSCAALGLLVLSLGSADAQKKATSLKDAYKDAFKIGAAISSFDISSRNPKSIELITSQFNAISPGNELKPESLHPKADVWAWDRADAYVEFGQKNHLWTLGHTLCWHNQTPDHFFFKENGEYKSHDELVETLRSYIETVCTHFGNKVNAWDVECIPYKPIPIQRGHPFA